MKKIKELLFLKNLKGIGNVTINKKYLDIISETENFEAFVEHMAVTETKWTKEEFDFAKEKAEQLYSQTVADSITAITVFDEDYPANLNSMKDKRPVVLFALGDTSLLSMPGIAYVGTRRPTTNSVKVIDNMVRKTLELSDVVIVSGLAVGSDKAAHEAAVNVNGKTVAVLPSGVKQITPAWNRALARKILSSGGCLVSEYEPDALPTKATFVERDYIIAALSNATIVVQCDEKSGTMHTVDRAYELQRRIACYVEIAYDLGGIPLGNKYMIDKFDATTLSNTEELRAFLSGTASSAMR